jgi:hypothetical protein
VGDPAPGDIPSRVATDAGRDDRGRTDRTAQLRARYRHRARCDSARTLRDPAASATGWYDGRGLGQHWGALRACVRRTPRSVTAGGTMVPTGGLHWDNAESGGTLGALRRCRQPCGNVLSPRRVAGPANAASRRCAASCSGCRSRPDRRWSVHPA